MQSRKLSTVSIAITALLFNPIASAQNNDIDTDAQQSIKDEIVISASRVETKRVETGSSITVLDEKYLEQNQSRRVAEILRDVPGVNVASTGGFGKSTSVFIRGGASANTVVIIDGVKVSDRSSSSGGFNFAHLMTDDIERIEVLRGPQSSIWGSDAMGGVINITTKKGKGPTKANLTIEAGSHQYHKEVANISGGTDNSHFSLTVSNIDTEGYSAKTGDGDDPDDDGYSNQHVAFKGGYEFTPIFSMDAIFNYTTTYSEYDSYNYGYGSTPEDDDVYGKYRQQLAKINSYLNLLDNRWKNRLSASYSASRTEDFDPLYTDWSTGDAYPYRQYNGDNFKGEFQSDFLFNTGDFSNRFTFVTEYENSTFLSYGASEKEEMDNTALIAELSTNWQHQIFVTASFRQDYNTEFDNTNSYKFDVSAWATDTIRVHTSYGTGVKNPTFSQLYGAYATPDLNTETSRGGDIGIEYNFAKLDGYIDLTYFDSKYIDAIRYDSTTYSYVNQDEDSHGIELSSFININPDLRINAQYTYMKSDDGTAEKNELLRRPAHSASANANYAFTQKWSANFGVQYVGERLDYGDIDMPSYTLVNLATSYQVHKRVSLYGRIDNLFNKEYEEVTDYGTEGIAAYIGVTIK